MKWKKLGCIYKTAMNQGWQYAHSMLPTAEFIENSICRVYFSGRDEQNRSLIGYFLFDVNDPFRILDVAQEPVLGLGELGAFDDNGVTPSSIVSIGDTKYLYYIGWKPRSTTRMSLTPGVAISHDGGKVFKRISKAPILHQTDSEPYFILTAPFVLKDIELWRMWYVSGVEWVHSDLPRYNIKYGSSKDGLHWEQTGHVCIDFKSHEENALARPCVIKDNGLYKMWFAYKGNETTYRIGYAESKDGLQWNRNDQLAGMGTSDHGWDSEMVEYAFVIKHKENNFMFYNGNDYGQSGIGLAIAE